MNGGEIDLPGWDRLYAESHITYIRADRRAKITVKPARFADRGDGWIAKLWTKETPHGRSRYQTDIAATQPAELREKLSSLAEDAP